MRTIGIFIITIIFGSNLATAQDTMFVYKAGSISYQQAVSNIDSITFKKSTYGGGTVTDIDGNVYHTVTIGTQVWMVENLKTTKYRNGDSIPYVADGRAWVILTDGAHCNYNNDAVLGDKYGKLYNWYAVADSRKIAPAGWHVPSDNEWTTLETYLEPNYGSSGSVGKALATKTDWVRSSYIDAVGNDLTKNNSSGFSALPGGCRSNNYERTDMSFVLIGEGGYWWSTTEYANYWAWDRILYNFANDIDSYYYNFKIVGKSVRCIKD